MVQARFYLPTQVSGARAKYVIGQTIFVDGGWTAL